MGVTEKGFPVGDEKPEERRFHRKGKKLFMKG